MNSRRRFARWHWLALVVVLLASAWFQFTAARETHLYNLGGPDAGSYASYAKNLHDFRIYSRHHPWEPINGSPVPDAVSPPGYPLFLVPFLQGTPSWFLFMQRAIWAQAMLGVLTVLLTVLLASRVAGPAAALVVGLLTAVTPHLITITTNLLTESLFTFLLLASTFAFTCAVQDGKRWRWVVAGLLFGACCLVRPTLQLLPLLALAVVAWRPGARPWLKGTAIAVACCTALLLPWLAYQHTLPEQSGQLNLLRATLYHGSFPGMMYEGDPQTLGFAYDYDPRAAEIMSGNAALVDIIGARMRAQPLRYLQWYLVGKPLYFLSWDNSSPGAGDAFIEEVADSPFFHRASFRLAHAAMYILHWPLMALGIAGALLALLRPGLFANRTDVRAMRLVAGLAVATIVLHMIGAPYPRYSIPFWPLFYLLAVALVQVGSERIGSRGKT